MTRARSTAKPTRSRSLTKSRATPANGADRQIKIGEAARIVGVEAYVLRFWETQFPFLRPRHSRSKHRYYDEKNLDYLRLIRRLLHSEGYTIAGARKHIREAGLDRLRAGSEGDRPLETGDRQPRGEGARAGGDGDRSPRSEGARSAGDGDRQPRGEGARADADRDRPPRSEGVRGGSASGTSKGSESAASPIGRRDDARPATSRTEEFSRATQDKLAAIRDELRSLHKLLAG